MVDENGKYEENVSFSKSLKKAQKLGLELVLFGPENTEKLLFKIIDLEKFLIPKVERFEKNFEQIKILSKLKDKEYQFRNQIQQNDLLVKLNFIKKNLLKNYRISIVSNGQDSMKNVELLQKIKNTILKEMKEINVEIIIDQDIISNTNKSSLILYQKINQ